MIKLTGTPKSHKRTGIIASFEFFSDYWKLGYMAQARSKTTVSSSDMKIDPSTPNRLENRKTLRTLFKLSRETLFPKSRRAFVYSLLRLTVFLHCLQPFD